MDINLRVCHGLGRFLRTLMQTNFHSRYVLKDVFRLFVGLLQRISSGNGVSGRTGEKGQRAQRDEVCLYERATQ